jgi:hypothetical protein
MRPRTKRQRQGGNVLVEFSLVMVFLCPMLLGMLALGLNVGRHIQVTQVARDAGHMYARFVDFSLVGNKNILVRLADGMGMTVDGGNGVVILSKITYIANEDCLAAGATGGDCVNRDSYVFTNRLYIGNRALKSSPYGTPVDSGLDAKGNVIDIYRDASARAIGFGDTLTLNRGEYAFLAETYFRGVLFTFPGLAGRDIFVRTIF